MFTYWRTGRLILGHVLLHAVRASHVAQVVPRLARADNLDPVAVIRLPGKPTSSDIDRAIETLIAALQAQSLAHQLWIVESGRIRVYSPQS